MWNCTWNDVRRDNFRALLLSRWRWRRRWRLVVTVTAVTLLVAQTRWIIFAERQTVYDLLPLLFYMLFLFVSVEHFSAMSVIWWWRRSNRDGEEWVCCRQQQRCTKDWLRNDEFADDEKPFHAMPCHAASWFNYIFIFYSLADCCRTLVVMCNMTVRAFAWISFMLK